MKFSNIPGYLKVRFLYLLTFAEKKAYANGLLKPDPDLLPNFLCIGAQKAGTTWLYQNLRCHPGLFIPDERKLHYFDHNFFQPLTFYTSHFKGGEKKVRGEVMPGYGLLMPARIKFIKKIMPELQIIFLIRNPIERAWSHARMHFTKFKNRALSEVSESELITHFNSDLSTIKGGYLKIIGNWEKEFPSTNIHVYFFEDIAERPKELFQEILESIGAPTEIDFSDFKLEQKVNVGDLSKIPEKCLDHLKASYKKDIYSMREKFGARVDKWINQYYE